MKFVHIADTHFDTPFRLLSDKANLGEIRRLDQRNSFKKMIEYIKENDIKYLFISGDFYDHEHIRPSTIDYINDCFKQIPDTLVFITPGNHDPYIKNSYYNKYSWNDNVKIFTSKIEKVTTDECDIYGLGFDDFHMKNNLIEEMEIENKDKINILITHGSLDSGNDEQRNYNPMLSHRLKQLGFDYIALGHIHKCNLSDENKTIIYPGSTISLGFDELGQHGMIVGDIDKEKKDVQFINLDEKEFKEIQIDVTQIETIEELLDRLQNIELKENELYKVIFIGNRNFEIDPSNIFKIIDIRNIIKIKDNTQLGYDLEQIANDVTLKGIFTKEMINKLNEENADKELIEKAIEIGLDSLM